jgi:high affinity cGMP-specific 3',5'-cyclic phosphodiesterase 9
MILIVNIVLIVDPGFNNAYQINANTELALIYNDSAPLEMHHACNNPKIMLASLFFIFNDEKSNIFASLDEQEKRNIRNLILRCILSTDMAKHGIF